MKAKAPAMARASNSNPDRKAKKLLAFRLFAQGFLVSEVAAEVGIPYLTMRHWKLDWNRQQSGRPKPANKTPRPYATGCRWGIGITLDIL